MRGHSPPGSTFHKHHLAALLLAALSLSSLWVLQPVIAVGDVDAYASVVGSYSIQRGGGYRSLCGDPLNHWPPGYSALLAFFPQPLEAAKLVNVISFGCAVALMFLLAVKNKWPWEPALGLSLVLGSGIFRHLAANAKPDILTYACFLLAALFYFSARRRLHIMSYWIWIALIPFKWVAALFAPAGLLTNFFSAGPVHRLRAREKAVILTVWAAVVGGLFLFNRLTAQEAIPSSFDRGGYRTLPIAVLEMLFSIPRSAVSHWYGSIKEPTAFFLFSALLLVGCWSFLTLRVSKEDIPTLQLGALTFLLLWVLRSFLGFDTGVRLSGYALILLLAGFRPAPGKHRRWLLYAAVSVFVALANVSSVNALGANDPRYRRLAQNLSAAGLPSGIIYSNSFHLLDLHVKHPSEPVEETHGLPVGSYFLWVTLPRYDGIATPVWPMPMPDARWREVISVNGATLFQRKGPYVNKQGEPS